MVTKTLGQKFRPKSHTMTYHQIGTYLKQKELPDSLIEVCVDFLKDRARESGEVCV